MLRTFINSKIHNICVTDKSIDYQGSVSIAENLLRIAGIEIYEQVQIINLNNGERWTTYAIAGAEGSFSLNGGGARLGEVGDRCVILTYALKEEFENAQVVYCDECNQIINAFSYEAST